MCKEFKGLRFKKAQDVVFHSVEQYSVLDEDGKEVGHVSLRGGLLTCEYPHKTASWSIISHSMMNGSILLRMKRNAIITCGSALTVSARGWIWDRNPQ